MPSTSFVSPEGTDTINLIVKRVIPHWTNGLRKIQLLSIPRILNLEDVFAIEATGGGKSALFGVAILVHLEISKNQCLYPKFDVPIRSDPVGVVITPTKGLATNIVKRLKEDLGIAGFAYTSENLSAQRRAGIDFVRQITSCQFRIICVDPEHLRESEWILIANATLFRKNLIFACVEEGHIINHWGLSFRPQFLDIGRFVRGRFPSTISVFSLSATMQPGPPLASVCSTLGFSGPRFHLIRHSIERPNTKIILETLTSPIGGTEFPQLLPILNERRKTVIHGRTIDLCYRIFMYLFKHTPPSSDPLRRLRMYNSLASEKYNARTIELINTDPQCQVIIATEALTLGADAHLILDSISVGSPPTQDKSNQDAGCAGRKEGAIARRIIMPTTAELTQIKKIVQLSDEVSVTAVSKVKQMTKSQKESKTLLDPAMVVFLAETLCHVACENTIYDNPPVETSRLDCIQASRRLPCDLCCTRYHIPKDPRLFSPSSDEISLPPFLIPPPYTKPHKSEKKADDMKKKEIEEVSQVLIEYEERLYAEERLVAPHRYRPRSMYFPKALREFLASNLSKIKSRAELNVILASNDWPYIESQSSNLFELISTLQNQVVARRPKPTSKMASTDPVELLMEVEGREDSEVS